MKKSATKEPIPERQPIEFEHLLKLLDHIPAAKYAAIRVHDDLDVAMSIAWDVFHNCSPDLVFRIRELLIEEEDHAEDPPDVERRVRRA